MSDVLNPADIESRIQSIARRIHEGVSVVSNADAAARKAKHVLDLAFARAYLGHNGPAHERKYAAEIATEKEREACDIAEVAFKHAERTAKALDAELRAMQSIGASIRSMYQGERGFGG